MSRFLVFLASTSICLSCALNLNSELEDNHNQDSNCCIGKQSHHEAPKPPSRQSEIFQGKKPSHLQIASMNDEKAEAFGRPGEEVGDLASEFELIAPLTMDSEDDDTSTNYRYEPTAAEILDNLLPHLCWLSISEIN